MAFFRSFPDSIPWSTQLRSTCMMGSLILSITVLSSSMLPPSTVNSTSLPWLLAISRIMRGNRAMTLSICIILMPSTFACISDVSLSMWSVISSSSLSSRSDVLSTSLLRAITSSLTSSNSSSSLFMPTLIVCAAGTSAAWVEDVFAATTLLHLSTGVPSSPTMTSSISCIEVIRLTVSSNPLSGTSVTVSSSKTCSLSISSSVGTEPVTVAVLASSFSITNARAAGNEQRRPNFTLTTVPAFAGSFLAPFALAFLRRLSPLSLFAAALSSSVSPGTSTIFSERSAAAIMPSSASRLRNMSSATSSSGFTSPFLIALSKSSSAWAVSVIGVSSIMPAMPLTV